MTALPKHRMTEGEYLAIERAAEYKSEFWDGEMYAMAGAALRHGAIGLNIGAQLNAQFRGRRCHAYMNDVRVRVADSGMYTYPDVVALCGEPLVLDAHEDTLLNPQLLVEVLSPSTERYDRNEKLWRYRQLESLTDILFVAQDRFLVERWSRDTAVPHVWTHTEYFQPTDRIRLVSLNAELALSDIYDGVDFSARDPSPAR
jgi:Uma2 family endonuclease